ncbi:glycosyl transferase family protein [Calothrix sp. NIES-4071]|nr:glycosyl transferase family protein [Calothrix sp. NIES-4071]BAZ57331.1 glycosyl transferase family protein [Calothrix sp. NIES-4105]
MTHYGIICLQATGHLNTVFPLGRELQQRGHTVTIFSGLEALLKVQAAGFNFCEVYSPEPSPQLKGFANIKNTLQQFARIAETRLQKSPAMLREYGVDVLLVDLSVFEGGTIADHLAIPYITICCMLPFYEDLNIPPIPTTWQYNPALWAKLRNRAAYSLFNFAAQPVWQVISKYRQKWNLPIYKQTNDIFSKLAIITRHIREFEFPRQLPPYFHFTGPFHNSVERQPVEFPFEKLNDKPLIYASMGTLQNRLSDVFYTIAEACKHTNAQLVISLGGGLAPEAFPNLPGNPLVVKYAPQLELLQKASLNITHAGLNTTLESLSYGVPMVAIPVTDDQPGVAARIKWTGTGELITLSNLSVTKLKESIQRVLTQNEYKQNAVKLQKAISCTGGVSRAADIIERVV